jgi:hypothetical protein
MRTTLALALCISSVSLAMAADKTALNDADCSTVWRQAGGKTLSPEAAKPYVLDFKQVDVDDDGSIDYEEFVKGCKAGQVKKSSS